IVVETENTSDVAQHRDVGDVDVCGTDCEDPVPAAEEDATVDAPVNVTADATADASFDATADAPIDEPEPEPVWDCGGFVCDEVNVNATLGQARAIDGCHFELAFEAPLAEGQALAERLLERLEGAGVGSRRSMPQILSSLNRVGRAGLSNATQTRLSGLNPVGFRWNTGDENVSYWYPQGITGSSDTSADDRYEGRRLVMTSWYHKTDERPTRGVRISLADITDLGDVTYRHMLLVDPVETADGPDYGPAEYDSGNALHAGGIVWIGEYLYVVDTVRGIRIYDLSRIFRLSHVDDTTRIGISGDRSDAHGYRYAIPRIARYRLTSDSCAVRFAFVGLERDSIPPVFVTGEYFSDHPNGKVVTWPVDPQTGLLEARQGTTRATQSVVIGQTRAQGALRVQDRFYVSSSSQDGSNGRLYTLRPGQANTSVNWVYGAEDLYHERGPDLVWTTAEHPGSRDVVAIPRP
ncbi:MAG: hypothetical protein ACNA8W_16170, partial [Bradymonadaceae bacterium]